MSECWISLKSAKLQKSHIIPAFVFSWLKDSAGSPYLRKGDSPNRRVQDGDTHELYCWDCEQMLGGYKNLAKKHIFTPATQRQKIEGRYSGWLSRFAASLAMRTIHSQQFRNVNGSATPINFEQVTIAAETWRKFILGEIGNPGKFRLYFIHNAYFDHYDAEDFPTNWNTFIHRAVERDIAFSEDRHFCTTYVKLGPISFFGSIQSEAKHWKQKSLSCGEAVFPNNNFAMSSMAWDFYLDRARGSQEMMSQLSEKATRKNWS